MLKKDVLYTEIRKINDIEFEEFEGFPDSLNAAAERWSQLLFNYCEEIIPPSITLEQAKQASYLEFLKVSRNPKQFELAIEKFADVMKNGMIGFTGVMPPVRLNMVHIFTKGFAGASAIEIAEEMSDFLHYWFKTGTAINNRSGVIINWN